MISDLFTNTVLFALLIYYMVIFSGLVILKRRDKEARKKREYPFDFQCICGNFIVTNGIYVPKNNDNFEGSIIPLKGEHSFECRRCGEEYTLDFSISVNRVMNSKTIIKGDNV